jgi:hypothetical protein
MDTHPSAVDTVTVYNLLKSPHRQHVLRILRHDNTPIDLNTLVGRITEQSGRDSPVVENQTVAAESRLETRLHHVHLPNIAEAGVITYDAGARVVVSFDGDRFDSLLSTGREVVASLQRDAEEVDPLSRD